MADFYEVFKDWENQITPDYKPKFPDIPFPNKPNVNDPRYMEELKQVNQAILGMRKESSEMLKQCLASAH